MEDILQLYPHENVNIETAWREAHANPSQFQYLWKHKTETRALTRSKYALVNEQITDSSYFFTINSYSGVPTLPNASYAA